MRLEKLEELKMFTFLGYGHIKAAVGRKPGLRQ
jgi:hypothetical protein